MFILLIIIALLWWWLSPKDVRTSEQKSIDKKKRRDEMGVLYLKLFMFSMVIMAIPFILRTLKIA